jgi:hypothetical protein
MGVLDSVCGGAFVLIDLRKVLSIGRDQDDQPGGPLGKIGPIVHAHAIQFVARAQINLPPRAILMLCVEAPLAVLDPVARSGGVLLSCDGRLRGAKPILQPPIGLDQPSGDH